MTTTKTTATVPAESAKTLVIAGVIERGDARGRTIGFPTANLAIGDARSVRDGVYAGWLVVEGFGVYPAAINVGTRPTFYASGVRLAEAHAIDFEGDLYGYRAKAVLVARLRSEITFASLDELVQQLRVDVEDARQVLGRVAASEADSPACPVRAPLARSQ